MNRTLGHFVVKYTPDGRSYQVLEEHDGVLYLSDKATFFPDYASARTAINRTLRYAAKENYQWGGRSAFRIRALVHRQPRSKP